MMKLRAAVSAAHDLGFQSHKVWIFLTLKPLPDPADTAVANGLHKERSFVALMDVWSQRMFEKGGEAAMLGTR
ncbi:hypothetical protein EYF80_027506 [Liparis tanakae]|uniref:Uncharacterized protein n=1 Tax=Liparis tanakae TaxID=230148 RepID=A0A4Z2HBT2_9TELE|nr:hypothetical protein EYF80_027506 [Liparis tanakae]